jgi:P-type E1-E2 ATPase
VLVVATPCPLLIAIPVAIIGSVSLAARRGIIIRDPAILEKVSRCRTALFDKTGTLTYGKPTLTETVAAPGFDRDDVLSLTASLERYSRHPLAVAALDAARENHLSLTEAVQMSERPGEGLRGVVSGRTVRVTSRAKLLAQAPESASQLPEIVGGMEAIVLVNDAYAGTLRFRDEPREDGSQFIRHLFGRHRMERVMLISGDRESEVRYLADKVGIEDARTRAWRNSRARKRSEPTRCSGDGINDAPALTAATVGVAFGQASDITSEAAGAVILDSSLARVDELLHIGRRMRTIALQSAVGGMALSVVGMLFAAAGYLPPVAGAITQEIIDVFAVVNALRVAIPPRSLTDYDRPPRLLPQP